MPAICTTPDLEQAQDELETRAVRDGVLYYREIVAYAVRKGRGSSLAPAERLLAHWFEAYTARIADEVAACAAGQKGIGRHIYGPVIHLIEPEAMAVLAMHETVSACLAEPRGIKFGRIAHIVGRAIFAEINLRIMAKTQRESYDEIWRQMGHHMTPKAANWWSRKKLDDVVFDMQAMSYVGAMLIKRLVEIAILGEWDQEPHVHAFIVETRYETPKTVRYVQMIEDAFDLIDDAHRSHSTMVPRFLPMVVPPARPSREWPVGYRRIHCPQVYNPKPDHLNGLRGVDLNPLWDCQEAVNATPWRINRRIREVQNAVWDEGGGTLGVPRREPLPQPPFPPIDDPLFQKVSDERIAIWKRNRDEKGVRSKFIRKRIVAEIMEPFDRFWFPHQIDFRTRCYSQPLHVNPQGDDIARGLLEFSEPKDASDSMDWVRVQAANCYGMDKIPFPERIAWARDHEGVIRACARDPLNTDFWRHAKEQTPGGCDGKPWEFLSACIAIEDPEAAARLPVRFDGTCNGLQHYAALGRDPEGAAAVNLTPGDWPADVYKQVAAMLRDVAQRDMETTGAKVKCSHRVGKERHVREVPLRDVIAIIFPKIGRSLVKQPVLASYYGVTYGGATRQFLEAFKGMRFDHDLLFPGCNYLARILRAELPKVCRSARAIGDWLQACGEAIARAGNPVRLTTPIGFVITQHYRDFRRCRIHTEFGDLDAPIPSDDLPVNVRKQREALAPNTIHCLDAAHMYMTALECWREDIAFYGVHDGFGTHAATASPMRDITREQFVALHSRPLLEELVSELRQRNHGVAIPDAPPRGNFDVRKVLGSEYFFS